MLLSACSTLPGAGEEPTTRAASSESTEVPSETADPALSRACGEFWGDPDYTDPLSRVVLDRAATAADAGASDPLFYAMTGDDIDLAFEQVPADAQEQVAGLADWFRTEPEKGADADLEAFEAAWASAAEVCAGVSDAAAWAAAPGADGTKPATLVCADVFDTPGTLTPFANANVLTSNMFKLVGLSPRAVPADGMDLVSSTNDLLAAEITAVDDEQVAAALEEVRAPFQDALNGDTWSDGLQEPLEHLIAACDSAGYGTPEPGDIDDGDGAGRGEDGEGLV